MGIKEIMGGEKRGMRCEPGPDGNTQVCTPYRILKGEKMATGTQVTIGVDEKCNPVLQNSIDMLDEDQDAVDNIAKKLSASCKKGFA